MPNLKSRGVGSFLTIVFTVFIFSSPFQVFAQDSVEKSKVNLGFFSSASTNLAGALSSLKNDQKPTEKTQPQVKARPKITQVTLNKTPENNQASIETALEALKSKTANFGNAVVESITQTAKPKPVETVATTPVITRTTPPQESISSRMSDLETRLRAEIYKTAADNMARTNQSLQSFGLGNRINQLTNVVISSPTISSPTITSVTFPDNITASSGTFSGALSVSGATTLGSFTAGVATTSSLFVSGTASSTNLVVSGLGSGSTQCLQISGTGIVSGSGSACGGGSGSSVPNVTYTTIGSLKFYTASTTATDNLTWRFNNGFVSAASSTVNGNLNIIGNSTSTNATSTILVATTLASTTQLVVSNGGASIGTTLSVGGAGTFSTTLGVTGLTTLGNASTTFLSASTNVWVGGNATTSSNGNFATNGTLTVTGLSTLGNASTTLLSASTNLWVGGNATTSSNGNFTTIGSIGVGSTTPWALLSVNPLPGLTGPAFVVGSSSATSLVVTNGGLVGIGTTTPYATLSVQGTSSAPAFSVSIGTSTIFGSSLKLIVTSTGLHGVGATSSPSAQLALAGNAYLDSNVVTFSSSTASSLIISYQSRATTTIANGLNNAFSIATSSTAIPMFTLSSIGSGISGLAGFGTSTPWGRVSIEMGSANPAFVISNNGSSSPALFVSGINQNGTIGIGTSSPAWALQIAGTTTAKAALALSDATAGANLKHWVLSSLNGALLIATSSDLYATSTVSALTVTSNGYVGIGSTTPTSNLSVNGNVYLGSTVASTLTIHAGTINYPLSSTSTIPIGVNTWSIATSTGANTTPIISISNSTTTGNATTTVSFFGATTTGMFAGANSPMAFKNMLIVGNGSVGASITVPNGAICVDSDGWCTATSSGQISAVGYNTGASDLAENYTETESMEAGDIVSAAGGETVSKATVANENKILGVFSTKPGVTLGLDNDIQNSLAHPIALSGRVPVKVNLEGGDINVGDRITISSVAGVGTKATSSDRTTVGIALDSFNSLSNKDSNRVGKVLMFVNLGRAKLDSGLAMIAQGHTNAWAVDEQSGRIDVNFFGNINLQGNALLDVSRISGFEGKWGISQEGKLTASEIQTEKICVGSICLDEAKLKALLIGAGLMDIGTNTSSSTPSSIPDSGSGSASSTDDSSGTATTTP